MRNRFLKISHRCFPVSNVKHFSKGYLFSYQTFDSLDILISTQLSLVLRKFKLHQGNWHRIEVRFNESVHVKKVESVTYFLKRFQATPWPSFTPLFKIFVPLPSFLFHPLLRYLRQFPSPSRNQPPTALIWPTYLTWFKQKSKGQFYQFNSRFLSKMNFLSFKSLYK